MMFVWGIFSHTETFKVKMHACAQYFTPPPDMKETHVLYMYVALQEPSLQS